MSAVVQPSQRASSVSNTEALAELWRQNQRPLILKINGRQFKIADESSFKMLLDLIERLDNIAAIQEGLDDVAAGRTVSLDRFSQNIREKNGI